MLTTEQPAWFDFGTFDENQTSIQIASSLLELSVFWGDSPISLVDAATSVTGRMKPLPHWLTSGCVSIVYPMQMLANSDGVYAHCIHCTWTVSVLSSLCAVCPTQLLGTSDGIYAHCTRTYLMYSHSMQCGCIRSMLRSCISSPLMCVCRSAVLGLEGGRKAVSAVLDQIQTFDADLPISALWLQDWTGGCVL